jgi:hypothetical protein
LKIAQKLILLVIILYALLLRLPQLDSPSIGYHNMKENEYISIAKNMLKSGDFFTREVDFLNSTNGSKDYGYHPQVPYVAYQIALGFKFFGNNSLWFPRLLNILYMLVAIIVLFAVTRILTGEFFYAIAAALLLAIFPVSVFFSRNLQPDTGAFLCMMAGQLYWLKFLDGYSRRRLAAAGCFLALAGAFKLSFLIGVMPLLLLVPYKEYFARKGRKQAAIDIAIFAVPFLIFAGYFLLMKQTGIHSAQDRVSLFRIFMPEYWTKYGFRIIRQYAIDENYGVFFFLMICVGIMLSWVRFRSDKSLLARYVRGWSLALIPYCMVFNDFIWQHNYYQMPFMGLAALSVVYGLKPRADIPFKPVKAQELYLFVIFFLLLCGLAWSDVKGGIKRHFSYIIAGGDVVGGVLKKELSPGEKIAVFTWAQGYAPCVYAECKCATPSSLEQIKELERNGLRFIVVTNSHQEDIPDDIWNYLQAEYRVYLKVDTIKRGHEELVMAIFKKGGSFNAKTCIVHDPVVWTKQYQTMSGRMRYKIIQEKTAGRQ